MSKELPKKVKPKEDVGNDHLSKRIAGEVEEAKVPEVAETNEMPNQHMADKLAGKVNDLGENIEDVKVGEESTEEAESKESTSTEESTEETTENPETNTSEQ